MWNSKKIGHFLIHICEVELSGFINMSKITAYAHKFIYEKANRAIETVGFGLSASGRCSRKIPLELKPVLVFIYYKIVDRTLRVPISPSLAPHLVCV